MITICGCAARQNAQREDAHTIYPQPGKGESQFNEEYAYCGQFFYTDDPNFAQCMVNLGNHVPGFTPNMSAIAIQQYLEFARAGANQPPPPPEPETTPQPETTPEQETAPATTTAQPSGGTPLSGPQQRIIDVLISEGVKASAYCAAEAYLIKRLGGRSHGVRCTVMKTFEGAYQRISRDDIDAAVCSNPDALQRIPFVTPAIETEMTAYAGC
jgi:hypothetical protein